MDYFAYQSFRKKISAVLHELHPFVSQVEIAQYTSKHSPFSFSNKDITYLLDPNNNRWKGQAKTEKLVAFYDAILLMKQMLVDPQVARNNPKLEEANLKKVVQSGVEAEFAAYKAIPNIELALHHLKKVYFQDRPGYNRILQVVERQQKRNWIINDQRNPSHAEILDITVEKLEDEKAIISTSEVWYLKWFDPSIEDYTYIYNKQNVQNYILRICPTENVWKIDANLYPSQTGKVPPRIGISNTRYETLTPPELVQTVKKTISDGITELALDIIIFYSEKNELLNLNDKAILIKAKLNEIIRFRNIDQITLSTYQQEKEIINKEILTLLAELN